MDAEHDLDLARRARAAYERARLVHGGLRAALLALAVALLGSVLVDAHAWRWAPLTFALWTWIGWRGGPLLTAARYGLAAGALTFVLPLSVLRPCCRPGMEGTACTMPEMCVAAGLLVGLPIAMLGLGRAPGRARESALGTALGVLSLATVKCGALFAGEAIGLLAGLALGIAAASAYAALLAPRPA